MRKSEIETFNTSTVNINSITESAKTFEPVEAKKIKINKKPKTVTKRKTTKKSRNNGSQSIYKPHKRGI